MTWVFNVYVSTEGQYDIVLGRDLLTALGFYLKSSEKVISGVDGPYESCTDPMVDTCTYDYKNPNLKDHVKLEDSFMDAYIDFF